MNPLFLEQLSIGPMGNFAYLIGSSHAKKAALIDPGWDPEFLLDEIARHEVELTCCLLTHSHYDHVNALEVLLAQKPCPVYIHEAEALYLPVSGSNIHAVKDSDVIDVGGVSVEVMHTPGHSPGGVCYKVDNILFTGDTLFMGACGRWDLPGGDKKELYESLTQKIAQCAEDIVLYPGHDYGATPSAVLGEEKRTNPYLVAVSFDEFG